MKIKCFSSIKLTMILVLTVLIATQNQITDAIQVKEDIDEATTSKTPILQTNVDNEKVNGGEEPNVTLSSRQISDNYPFPRPNPIKHLNNITDKLTIPLQVISKNEHSIATRESSVIPSYNTTTSDQSIALNEFRNSSSVFENNFSPSPELRVPTEYTSQLVESSVQDKFLPIIQHNEPYNNAVDQKLTGDPFSPYNVKTESGYRSQPSSIVPDKSPWLLSFPENEGKNLNNQYLPVADDVHIKSPAVSNFDTSLSHQYQSNPVQLNIYQPYPFELPPNPQLNPPVIFPSEPQATASTGTDVLANEQHAPLMLASTSIPQHYEPAIYDRPEYVRLGHLKDVGGDTIQVRKSIILRNLLKIFATMVPIGLLISALAPHYITLNPNITLPFPPQPYPPPRFPPRPPLPPNRPPLPVPRPPPSNSIRYPPSGNRFYRVFSEHDFSALKDFLKKIKEEQRNNANFLTKFASCEQRYICEMALLAVDLDSDKSSARTLYKILWEISNELTSKSTPEKIDDIFKAVNKNDCERYHCTDYHLKTTLENEKN